MASALDEEKLIEIIRSHRLLYDQCDKYYHDSMRKDNAWDDVATKLQCSASECKKRWTALRDNYRKAMRKRTASLRIHKPWKHERSMTFLFPYISTREPRGSSQNTSDDYEERDRLLFQYSNTRDLRGSSHDYENQDQIYCEAPQMVAPNSPLSSRASSPGPPQTCEPKQHPSIETTLHNYFEQKLKKSDHLKKYFEAVEETVRTFHPQLQIEVKSKISAVLTEYEMKNLTFPTNIK